jgi:hypothetical protein
MRAKRHFWAALLILIFVPASMVRAMPLSFCQGIDGHKGVEFTASNKHVRSEVGGDPLVDSASDLLAAVIGADDLTNCIDTPLLTDVRSPGAATEDMSPPLTELPFFYVLASALLVPTPDAAASPRPPTAVALPSSQLNSLRTVVLHI